MVGSTSVRGKEINRGKREERIGKWERRKAGGKILFTGYSELVVCASSSIKACNVGKINS